ncbi:MAG: hypothetical protein ACOCVM_00015 [Desulfovibrionaceae bacterium]
MKAYVVILCVLYLTTLVNRALLLITSPPPVLAATAVVDVVVLGLALWASLCLAFNKRFFAEDNLRLLYQATLLVGVVGVAARVSAAGGMTQVSFGVMGVFLSFLTYVLFAVPVIIFDRETRRK